MADQIEYFVEEDGTISFKTGEISDVNHVSADEFFKEVFGKVGGTVTKEKNKDAKVTVHHGVHAHAH